MKKSALSIGIAFLVWAVIFFTQAGLGVGVAWLLATMFFISLPLSGWIARQVTGINPYDAMFGNKA
ncbi:TPA: hypothetical protein R4Y87_004718 [Serratia marcescens]|nr:hypothetical protein [Serratia marcescens]